MMNSFGTPAVGDAAVLLLFAGGVAFALGIAGYILMRIKKRGK